MSFTLNNLDDIQFEDFCYDLLQSFGFVNLNWRKGTGLTSSPSDQGRDIEGILQRIDFDGKQYYEKWFIECKHYIKGVPPDKILNAISWANAERPDFLLIIASNFLSNQTKIFLNDYQKNNNPPYKIRVWELKDLEYLTAEKKELRIKYALEPGIPFLSIINKYHIIYSVKPQQNTVEYFFKIMDALDPKKRDAAFLITYLDIINPSIRIPETGEETINDLIIDEIDYNNFREKCFKMESSNSSNFIHKLVSSTLAWLFNSADKTSLPDTQKRNQYLIESLEADVKKEQDDKKKWVLNQSIEFVKKVLKELPEKVEESFQLYTYICDELVRKLLAEKPKIEEYKIIQL